jgi:hypothetical protein
VLVGLIRDPPHELVGMDLGAAGRVERHCSPDLVRLLLLGQHHALGTHGVADGEGRTRKDLEGDGREEGGRAWWKEEAWGKIGILFVPFL